MRFSRKYLLRKYQKLRSAVRNIRYTLNGSKFQELKDHIDSRLGPLGNTSKVAFITQHSAFRLGASAPAGHGPLAVISCMPPAQTGIATCTLLTFREAPYPVDIFSIYESAEDYLWGISDVRIRGSNVRIFDAATLPLGLANNDYRAQLFILGNSDHNIPIAIQLRKSRIFPSYAPIHVYIHDPCLLNVCRKVVDLNGMEFTETINASYGTNYQTNVKFGELLSKGIYGIRPLLHDVRVQSFIVNSKAAQQIVAREMPGVPIHVLFHPLLPLGSETTIPREPALRIGTFGVPGDNKKTDLIIRALQFLRAQEPHATLVIAGFDVSRFAQQNGLSARDGLEFHDNPNDQAFDALIQSVDVAVQLRAQNLGESSGVISRLLQAKKPIIVSNHGAFAEYGPAVQFVDNDITPEALAQAILNSRNPNPVRDTAIDQYCSEHSIGVFVKKLHEILPRRHETS